MIVPLEQEQQQQHVSSARFVLSTIYLEWYNRITGEERKEGEGGRAQGVAQEDNLHVVEFDYKN